MAKGFKSHRLQPTYRKPSSYSARWIVAIVSLSTLAFGGVGFLLSLTIRGIVEIIRYIIRKN